jgi:carboxyl-terminal processing protease
LKRAALACALALAFAALPASAGAEAASISPLDLIELQISYTTLLARYYKTIPPRTLADGARTGVAAELIACGIAAANVPYPPARIDTGTASDYIDGIVLRTLARYGRRVDGHRLTAAAVAGELAALHDPYTLLFRPPQFAKFNAYLGKEKFGGIGAVLSYDEATGKAPVERVVPGGPAALAGLRAGDSIERVGAANVRALGAAGLRDALRGKIGTKLTLEFERGGTAQTLELVRAEIRDPQVETRRFGDVGYVRLDRFGDRAGSELAASLGDLRSGGARAFVLDLRANGGGFGDEATAVASDFIARGPIFTTRERTGPPVVARANGRAGPPAPLAVLVDGDTASAAEIVAGAIQDDAVGTIVGTRTFGKGVVQSIFPLPDGSALKVTTARYTTPKGRDIDRVGIVPDVVVAEPRGAVEGDPATDPQLAAALAVLARSPSAVMPSATP